MGDSATFLRVVMAGFMPAIHVLLAETNGSKIIFNIA
jgi:hypothetical protein